MVLLQIFNRGIACKIQLFLSVSLNHQIDHYKKLCSATATANALFIIDNGSMKSMCI